MTKQQISRSQRKRPAREFTLEPEIDTALAAHCERTHEHRSAVVNRALRKELGLKEEKR